MTLGNIIHNWLKVTSQDLFNPCDGLRNFTLSWRLHRTSIARSTHPAAIQALIRHRHRVDLRAIQTSDVHQPFNQSTKL